MMDSFPAYQYAIAPPALGGDSSNPTVSGHDLRVIWQHRTQKVAAFVATGNLHLAAIALSLTVLALSLCLRAYRIGRPAPIGASYDGKRPSVPLLFAFAHLLVSIAACSFSWLDLRHSTAWKLPVSLTYVALLGIWRLCCKTHSLKQQIYHHMNATATVVLMLGVLQYLIPMGIVGAKSRPTSMETAIIGCLSSMVAIFLLSPRPRQHFTPDAEAELQINETTSPEETCSLFSYYCSYEWMTHVIIQGCRRDLTMDDLPPLPLYDEPQTWLRKIKRQRQKGGKTFKTLRRLLKTEIRTMVFWSGATSLVEYVAPYAMLRLLAYLEQPSTAVVHPVIWIVLLFAGPTMRSVCYQRYIFTATRLLVRVNMSLVQEIYQTAMRSHIYDSSVHRPAVPVASSSASKEAPKPAQANLTSLMSYDVDAIYNARDIFYVATSGPISTCIAMVFLFQMLGWPSLFGVFTLVCLTPLPALASRKVSRIQRSIMQATDVRLSKIAEYLNSIRTLKYFGWEPAAMNRINEIRSIEQRRLWKRSVYAAAISMAGDLLPFVSLLVIFSIVILFTDCQLRAPIAFTALSIMETLRSQFVWISNVSQYSAQGAESLRRVDRFFESAEEIKPHPDGPLELTDATFRRTPIAAFRLQDLSVSFQQNALNVVTGPTGAGKTSLLLSLLGETILESGSATCPRDVAYVPQTPWLQNGTIRQNVIFYGQFNKARYGAAIQASGLAQDLLQFPNGDLTFVGERGTSLSGGQKQRISLARALYSHASTLLLDDIFSALDTHTTSLVYEKCFRGGLLANRTVLLVTSFPPAIRDAQMVIRLEHGRIVSVRTSSVSRDSQEDVNILSSQEQPDLQSSGDSSLTMQDTDSSSDVEIDHGQAQGDQSGRIVKEQSATGRVPRTLFLQYMAMFGGYSYAAFAILATLTVQFSYFGITYWLSVWTGTYSENKNSNSMFYLSIYAAVIGLFLILQLTNNLVYQYGGWVAAKKMHLKLVTAIMSAPVSWFDENPIGRAINRFGNDTRSMDTLLIDWLRMSIENGLRFLLRIASIASIMPIFALPAAIICSAGFAVGEMYTRAQISIKRLVSVNYSPVFSHFTDSLAGMSVIRARDGMDEVFQNLLAEKLAVHTRSAEALYNSNRWVSIRSDFCAASVSAAAGCVAYFKSGPPGLVGFSLSNAIGLSQTILTLVRTMNELEVELNSFQRMREYAEIEPEENLKENKTTRIDTIPASWPTSGRVEFQSVTARYHPEGSDVLRNVSFVALPGERIGIVGRTGSGKSTLGLSLLRFVDLYGGCITIDGIDINTTPLNRLRTTVTLIPQEPVLFSGNVHSNLDPFGQSSDTELRSALSACTSIHVPGTHNGSTNAVGKDRRSLALDTPVAANGENFSQGQRQVLSLARALCRRSKVVLLDEATASVDHETDAHMQRLLRSEFPESTIIAIAHRLRTIMDYDRVLVMADGEIIENDSPANLIQQRGVFWSMLRNTGEYDELVKMAYDADADRSV